MALLFSLFHTSCGLGHCSSSRCEEAHQEKGSQGSIHRTWETGPAGETLGASRPAENSPHTRADVSGPWAGARLLKHHYLTHRRPLSCRNRYDSVVPMRTPGLAGINWPRAPPGSTLPQLSAQRAGLLLIARGGGIREV